MPVESKIWEILPGETTSTTLPITIVDAASAGNPSALRTMTHPDSANFPIVTYNKNPDRTINFDQTPLPTPSSGTFRTLGTTQPFVTQNFLDDVIVTERWEAPSGTAPMTTAQYRRMYELTINPPAAADPEVFLQWAPADRTVTVYNVVILAVRVGGTDGKMDVKDNGLYSAGVLDAVATGLLDRVVEWDFLLVSEVP
jgi:hypothetical protein